ncbi:DUF3958 family protein [Paenilisteria rocourtiae]|uniref:Uncharacterized protein n=1 Tax=Listeria rocourtiae TaxID=647910 RepID=A0A4R6ZQH5_9LIST|nr:DUF3958 family protein [Listeria rocourtiae]EUJ43744.1 hypothetical protein PROCOU_15214 [Listeria rocourtiae FSL F6-920]MBC1604159.1 DUF3958 family protein [Listeria rocourtiae]TDR54662.1 hypothetical protein DFP96_102256 [Listeria rocourtiae]
MVTWDDLHLEERELLEKEVSLEKGTKQIQRVKESYEGHFHRATHFLDNVGYAFHKNDNRFYFESVRDEFLRESRKIMEHLEENERELGQSKRNIQRQIDDVVFEKRKLTLTKGAETDEC